MAETIIQHEDFGRHIATHADDHLIIDPREEIVIVFDYPLTRPSGRRFTSAGGFTRAAFVAAVAKGYAEIYAEEDKTRTLSSEPQGMLLNRSATDGVHGIAVHSLGDLYLEGAYRDDHGVWHLEVGS